MEHWDLVVIGGSIAGLSAAKEAKRLKPELRVLIVSEESHLPYKRTKLSKTIHNQVPITEILLEPEGFYDSSGIDIMPETRAVRVDHARHVVELDDRTELEYGKLILATGARPVYPPNIRAHAHSDFYFFRKKDDAERLIAAAKSAKTVLVSGMGVLGVELAEQLSLLGKSVTLMTPSPQVMGRSLNVRASEILESLLEKKKIRLRYLEEVLSYTHHDRGGVEITTVQGQTHFDLLVFAVGASPDLELAKNSGIPSDKGILVDEYLRTRVPDVFAVGDVAQHPDGSVTHLWHAAESQGIHAGRNAAIEALPYRDPGFRLKCEVFGNYFFSFAPPGGFASQVALEYEKGDRYLCLYLDGEKVSGIVMVNDKDHAKIYEQAVREQWPHPQVLKVFQS